ncbi:hypothetical protein XPA_010664 [Xanthoria parietina]
MVRFPIVKGTDVHSGNNSPDWIFHWGMNFVQNLLLSPLQDHLIPAYDDETPETSKTTGHTAILLAGNQSFRCRRVWVSASQLFKAIILPLYRSLTMVSCTGCLQTYCLLASNMLWEAKN